MWINGDGGRRRTSSANAAVRGAHWWTREWAEEATTRLNNQTLVMAHMETAIESYALSFRDRKTENDTVQVMDYTNVGELERRTTEEPLRQRRGVRGAQWWTREWAG